MENGIELTGTMFRNFMKFGTIKVEYPQGVSYLCGSNGAGKSSLTVVGLQACIKGIAEKDNGGNLIGSRYKFIGNNSKSADIIYTFYDARNKRYFNISNHITADKNNIKVEAEDGKPFPDDWLNDFLSVSLMSESNFCALSQKEQALTLGIDTACFDTRIAELKTEATALNRSLKIYLNLESIPYCERIDIEALQKKRIECVYNLNQKYLDNINKNKEMRIAYDKAKSDYETYHKISISKNEKLQTAIDNCQAALVLVRSYGYNGNELEEFIASLELPLNIEPFTLEEPNYIEELPSDIELNEIDNQLKEAYQINFKAQQYNEYFMKKIEKEKIEKDLEINKERQNDLIKERMEYIKKFDFGFANLGVNDAGELELMGRPIKKPYFSTGERIKIVARLMASRNPLFKTVFLDSACELDPDNLKTVIKDLTDNGFKVIVSLPIEKKLEGEHCIVLRDCEIVENTEEGVHLL